LESSAFFTSLFMLILIDLSSLNYTKLDELTLIYNRNQKFMRMMQKSFKILFSLRPLRPLR
ncbi:MAG: hypothetical protein V7L23_05460, partial [Nostoc sp.]|uniref:hypothetical protein n=1 Tax=Nostoc sp. TaxID=1180 RepID=UPI002FF06866